MTMKKCWFFWQLGLSFLAVSPSLAQMFSMSSGLEERPEAVRAVMGGFKQMNLKISSAASPRILNFQAARVLAGEYVSEGLLVRGALGTVDACTLGMASEPCSFEVRDIRAGLLNGLPLVQKGGLSLELPVALLMDFSRISAQNAPSTVGSYFGASVPYVATGLKGRLRVNENVQVQLHGLGGLGVAFQTQDNSLGIAKTYEANLVLHFPQLVNRFGLSAGLSMQGHDWDVKYTGFQFTKINNTTRYQGQDTSFFVGINF